jgi:GGDEF domain-containing protein
MSILADAMGREPTVSLQADDLLLIEPLTGFGSREKLFADLEEALQPDAAPSLLAVFGFAGISEYRELFGQVDTSSLLVEFAGRLREALQSSVTFYRPRKDEFAVLIPGEFAVLISGEFAATEPLLETAVATLEKSGRDTLVKGAYGVTLLPSEASDPIEAMMLADQQLSALLGRGPRDRRSTERRLNPR